MLFSQGEIILSGVELKSSSSIFHGRFLLGIFLSGSLMFPLMWLSYASGLFHCKGEGFCLPHDKVCDGQIQCMKFREDEKYCTLTGQYSLQTN